MRPFIEPSATVNTARTPEKTHPRGSRLSRQAMAAVAGGFLLGLMPAHGLVLNGPMLQGGTSTNVYVLAECSVNATSPKTSELGIVMGRMDFTAGIPA